MNEKSYKAIVIGVSAGGMKALIKIFSFLPADFSLPILVTQHLAPSEDSYLANLLNKISQLSVKEAIDKEKIKPGIIYLAPPNYHLLVERKKTISLSIDEKVNYSRPSIDVLFESAANAWGDKLIGIILTGSNSDGTMGMKKIKESGGFTIAEEPSTAEFSVMPKSAIDIGVIDEVLPLEQIGELIIKLSNIKNTAL
ncbi:MAG: chemotaxis protein CheB [Candidatus Stygibacter australis]|nr:chemotaxis protein CheB [Candidatus Stygibacter australis]MDP8321107.1 chemotaxis protein CheB [Candidatus Stygibacter australis]